MATTVAELKRTAVDHSTTVCGLLAPIRVERANVNCICSVTKACMCVCVFRLIGSVERSPDGVIIHRRMQLCVR